MTINKNIRLIGIDPGLQHTGWGIIDCNGSRISWVNHGVINPPISLGLADRLASIACELKAIIDVYKPHEASVEETFFANSAKTSLLLGHARGAALAILASNNIKVTEYATRKIKKAVVGTGTAQKDQVAFMVKRLLPNCSSLTSDASDALAAAICHSILRNSPEARWG